MIVFTGYEKDYTSKNPIVHSLASHACALASMPSVPIIVINNNEPIAYAYSSYIEVTFSLVELLTENELFSVIFHELSHIKYKDHAEREFEKRMENEYFADFFSTKFNDSKYMISALKKLSLHYPDKFTQDNLNYRIELLYCSRK